MIIEVMNWEKYNPRGNSLRPTWFRVENNLATGSGFFDLDCEQKWLWIFILSLVSQKNGDPIKWNFGYCEKMTGIKEKKQLQTIEIFEKFVRLRVSRKETLRDLAATNERTDVRTEKNEVSEPAPAGAPAPLDLGLPILNKGDPATQLLDLWNQGCGSLPKANELTEQRKRKAKARLKEKPDMNYWAEVVCRIEASAFCRGDVRNQEKPWRATFDWLLKSETHVKVMEGQYDSPVDIVAERQKRLQESFRSL